VERIWLEHYPKGVPAEIDVNEYGSLRDVFEESVAKYRSRRAYTCMGKSVTFAELDTLSRAFGAWLQRNGATKGTRIALMMPNILQYPICLFGVLRAGCTVVNVNPLYTPRELEHQIKDSGTEMIVVVENFAHTVAAIPHTQLRKIIVTSIGEQLGFKGIAVDFVLRRVKKMVPKWKIGGAVRLHTVLAQGRRHKLEKVPIGHDDIAFLQYTGGTTGVAKGAMLLHRNIIANLLQARAWVKPFLDPGAREVIITPLPLYHIFSLTANCLTFMTLGAENVLIPNPRDIPGLVKEMAKHKFTAFTGVNTLFNALVNNRAFGKLDFRSLRLTLGGGMAVQEAVAEKWQMITGKPLIEAYGLTETSPAATINPLDLPRYNGSIGLPISSTDVTIRADDGKEVPLGDPGEICIRGPQVMKGYWQRPDETAKVLDAEGWFATGDIGVMDHMGYIKIVDRKKDMIIVSGFNVYPNEIEGVVVTHPGVLECAAVGIPDKKSGEAVKLFVVKKDQRLTADEVLAHCREHLTNYKIPREVEFRKDLPKTNVGKILRRELRDEPRQAAA
jgi:long-chain acyl-CoA synthetase